MRFDTKIAVVVREDLAGWQRLNVTAFLVSGLPKSFPEILGEPYEDGAGNRYLPMFRQPVLVFGANAEALDRVHAQALSRGLAIAVYTDELFTTDNDADNRAAVLAAAKLRFAGLAVYGPRNAVDKTTKGLPLHR
ncbi:MAG: hypothetical protein QOE54_3130 [Streptosporangiaceae bacterium]|jgi:hypothetical protein|nr:hypothetical protein [Streptosporangiaceae bacterium]MDX6430764.1 hypothetical protein [Streptosporangiaceae bacterium]